MDRKKLDLREQRILKSLDKGNRIFTNIFIKGTYLLAAVMLVLAVYYGIGERNETMDGGRAFNYFGWFLIASATAICWKLLEVIRHAVQTKNDQFEPRQMVLPKRGTVTLETALHAMAIRMGVIYWDSLFGLLLGILLVLLLFVGPNIPLILLCYLFLTALVGGHFFWSWRWKKRPFAGKLLDNTQKHIPIENPFEYAAAVERSLTEGVLYYEREMILTDDFIIGLLETDIRFIPVAVPRAEIVQLAFFRRRPVMKRYQKYDIGILDCRLYSGQSVELLIGRGPRMERVLKVLNYYGLGWSEEETVYE